MTPEQLEELNKQIIDNLKLGADLASILAPQIVPWVVVGKALADVVPGLSGTVQRWVEGNPPTDDEKAELKAKLAILGDENLP